jgi:hypothetical protein
MSSGSVSSRWRTSTAPRADSSNQIAGGHVDAANPVVVFGYSQSSVISAQLMQELANQGVPSDNVHFVLVADESAPNGEFIQYVESLRRSVRFYRDVIGLQVRIEGDGYVEFEMGNTKFSLFERSKRALST